MPSEKYPDGFSYDPKSRRFRNKATGRFLSHSTVVRLRDDFAVSQERFVENITRSLAEGNMDLAKWETEVFSRIKRVYLAEMMLGRGGTGVLTDADRRAVSRLISKQQDYLRRFAREVGEGQLSEAKIVNRIKLYIRSSRQSYERGRSRAWGIRLPAYPADGSSECQSNDRCFWEIHERGTVIEAYWRLSVAEHCKTCLDRGSRWSPYRIERR